VPFLLRYVGSDIGRSSRSPMNATTAANVVPIAMKVCFGELRCGAGGLNQDYRIYINMRESCSTV
jgi:hypothetical protein